jgi:hypothetical protein
MSLPEDAGAFAMDCRRTSPEDVERYGSSTRALLLSQAFGPQRSRRALDCFSFVANPGRHDRIRVSRPRRSGHCAGDVPMLDVPLAGTSLFNHAFSDVYVSALVGQWVGGGFGSSRGAAAVPPSPSAGLLPSRGWAGQGSLAQTSFPFGSSPARSRTKQRLAAAQLRTRRPGRDRLSGT